MTKFVVGAPSDRIFEALHDAGVFTDEPSMVRRVVIDLECGHAARVYIDRFVDDQLTEVLLAGGLEIVTAPADDAVEELPPGPPRETA